MYMHIYVVSLIWNFFKSEMSNGGLTSLFMCDCILLKIIFFHGTSVITCLLLCPLIRAAIFPGLCPLGFIVFSCNSCPTVCLVHSLSASSLLRNGCLTPICSVCDITYCFWYLTAASWILICLIIKTKSGIFIWNFIWNWYTMCIISCEMVHNSVSCVIK